MVDEAYFEDPLLVVVVARDSLSAKRGARSLWETSAISSVLTAFSRLFIVVVVVRVGSQASREGRKGKQGTQGKREKERLGGRSPSREKGATLRPPLRCAISGNGERIAGDEIPWREGGRRRGKRKGKGNERREGGRQRRLCVAAAPSSTTEALVSDREVDALAGGRVGGQKGAIESRRGKALLLS
jgi:hypothetical protein